MDLLDSPVSQQQATLLFEVSASLGCAIDDLLCEGPVLWMNTLHHHVQGWLRVTIVLEDAIGFV